MRFGMCEMESAARTIYEKAKEANSWDINIRLSDFGDTNGFLQLLVYGWLEPNFLGGKGEFKITRHFLTRVEESVGATDFPRPWHWTLQPNLQPNFWLEPLSESPSEPNSTKE